MILRAKLVVAALCVALVPACGGDDDPAPVGPPADAVVTFKSTATDLNALDLREKLIQLPGVEGIVYDQPQKRLRVDFEDSATAAQQEAVLDTARKDASVARTGDGGPGDVDAPSQQPAPGASS